MALLIFRRNVQKSARRLFHHKVKLIMEWICFACWCHGLNNNVEQFSATMYSQTEHDVDRKGTKESLSWKLALFKRSDAQHLYIATAMKCPINVVPPTASSTHSVAGYTHTHTLECDCSRFLIKFLVDWPITISIWATSLLTIWRAHKA